MPKQRYYHKYDTGHEVFVPDTHSSQTVIEQRCKVCGRRIRRWYGRENRIDKALYENEHGAFTSKRTNCEIGGKARKYIDSAVEMGEHGLVMNIEKLQGTTKEVGWKPLKNNAMIPPNFENPEEMKRRWADMVTALTIIATDIFEAGLHTDPRLQRSFRIGHTRSYMHGGAELVEHLPKI